MLPMLSPIFRIDGRKRDAGLASGLRGARTGAGAAEAAIRAAVGIGCCGPPVRRSSLTIVPIAWASPSVALAGLDSVTRKVSLASRALSPLIVTANVRAVWPGENVSEPAAAA